MKKKWLIGAFALILVSLNVSVGRNMKYNEEEQEEFQLDNIAVLQSSAKESNCDKSNRNTCEVNHFPPSTGVLTVYE